MYTPRHFTTVDPAELQRFIRANSFATLAVVSANGGIEATHVPLLWRSSALAAPVPQTDEAGTEPPLGVLIGHVARANPIWEMLEANDEALAIFSGPHAYASPNYYVNEGLVPTWLYTAVHVYTQPQVLHGEPELRAILAELTSHYETGFAEPWSIARLNPERQATLLEYIVGIELRITRLEGKYKLDQPRKLEDRKGVIAALSESSEQADRAIAAMMRQRM